MTASLAAARNEGRPRPRRRVTRRVAWSGLFLLALSGACERTRSLETVLDAIASGELANAVTAREALALANADELVVVRRGVIDAVLHLDGSEFRPELRRAVVDAHPAVRLQAARALGRWGTADDLDALDKAAAIAEEGATPESAAATAANAAVRIRLVTDPAPAQRARADLESDIPQVRVSGAVNLGYYRWAPSIAALQQAVRNDTDGLARAMAVCALGSFDAEAITPVLAQVQEMLGAASMIMRRCAVKALSVSGRPEAALQIAHAFQEKDAQTRRWAVEGIERLNAAPQQQPVLLFAAGRDPDPGVRAAAMCAIAAGFDARVESVWRQAMTDAAPRVRAAAVHELVRAGKVDVVASALRDPVWEVRAAALIGLTRRAAATDGRG